MTALSAGFPVDTFKKQRRGGKGVSAISTKSEDFIKMMTIASTHDVVFLFSNKGKIFALKAYEIPLASKTSRGKSLKGIINLCFRRKHYGHLLD